MTVEVVNTEEKILIAAHDVFIQNGLEGAKMQEIADKAGINRALLNYYFRTKEKLFEKVANTVLSQAVPLIENTLNSDMPLIPKLENLVENYLGMLSLNSYLPLFLINEMNKHEKHFFDKLLPTRLPDLSTFKQQVKAEVQAGRIRETDPEHLIVNVVSLCLLPFIGVPMMRMLLNKDKEEMAHFLSMRKIEIITFLKSSLLNTGFSNH